MDALAVGEPQHEHRDALEPAEDLLDRADRDAHLAVVDPPRQPDELHLGCTAQQEVRVDGDAVAADAKARLVDVRVGLGVRRADDLLDVHPDAIRVSRELVGERDVDVAVGGIGELGELGGLGRRHRHDIGVEHRA